MMVFTILPLVTHSPVQNDRYHIFTAATDDIDIPDADHPSSSHQRSKLSNAIVTPGEIVTEDAQWMRYLLYYIFQLLLFYIFCVPNSVTTYYSLPDRA